MPFIVVYSIDWDMILLLKARKKDLKISDDMARGISRALGGSWDK